MWLISIYFSYEYGVNEVMRLFLTIEGVVVDSELGFNVGSLVGIALG